MSLRERRLGRSRAGGQRAQSVHPVLMVSTRVWCRCGMIRTDLRADQVVVALETLCRAMPALRHWFGGDINPIQHG